jgi:hypothetical protein
VTGVRGLLIAFRSHLISIRNIKYNITPIELLRLELPFLTERETRHDTRLHTASPIGASMLRKVTSSSKMSSRRRRAVHTPVAPHTRHADAPSSPSTRAVRIGYRPTRTPGTAPSPSPCPLPCPPLPPGQSQSVLSPPTAPRYHLGAPGRWSALSRSLCLVARVADPRSLSRANYLLQEIRGRYYLASRANYLLPAPARVSRRDTCCDVRNDPIKPLATTTRAPLPPAGAGCCS